MRRFMINVYKIINGLEKVDWEHLFSLLHNMRRSLSIKLKGAEFKTDTYCIHI